MIPCIGLAGVGALHDCPGGNRAAAKSHVWLGDLRRRCSSCGIERRERNQRLVPDAAQLDVHTREILERRRSQRPTVIRPDDAGVGRHGPVDVAAAIGTEDDLRVRMIAKRWKAGYQGLKGPNRIVWPEKRNRADRHSRSVCGVPLTVDQPEPATMEHDARHWRDNGPGRKHVRREYGGDVTLFVDLLDRRRRGCGALLGDPDCVTVKSHRRRKIQPGGHGCNRIAWQNRHIRWRLWRSRQS